MKYFPFMIAFFIRLTSDKLLPWLYCKLISCHNISIYDTARRLIIKTPPQCRWGLWWLLFIAQFAKSHSYISFFSRWWKWSAQYLNTLDRKWINYKTRLRVFLPLLDFFTPFTFQLSTLMLSSFFLYPITHCSLYSLSVLKAVILFLLCFPMQKFDNIVYKMNLGYCCLVVNDDLYPSRFLSIWPTLACSEMFVAILKFWAMWGHSTLLIFQLYPVSGSVSRTQPRDVTNFRQCFMATRFTYTLSNLATDILLPQISFTLPTVALGFLPPATVSTVLASPLLRCIKAILLADPALISLEVNWTSSFSLLLLLFCRIHAEGWFCLTLPCPDN